MACFGVPSIFSFKSNVCANCKEFADCQKESYSALLAIKEYPIATTMLSQHVEFMMRNGIAQSDAGALELSKPIPTHQKKKTTRYALTAEQIDRISQLPKKIGNFLEKIWVRGLEKQIMQDIRDNKNPFSEHNARPYHAAYEVLRTSRAHRSGMSNHLMETLGWTYQSAYSQVSMIWQIFPELGIAEVDGVHMTAIRPRNKEHNNEKLLEGNYD